MRDRANRARRGLVGLSFSIAIGFSISSSIGQVSGDSPDPAVVKGGVGVPVAPQPNYGALQPIVNEQAAVMQDLFCVSPANDLWVFELDRSPIAYATAQGTHTVAGIGAWTTRVVSEYDWLEGLSNGDVSAEQWNDLVATGSQAALLIGKFDGTCSSEYIIAIGLSRVIDDGVYTHFLIPVMHVDPLVSDLLDQVPPDPIIGTIEVADCETCEWGCCDQRYRGRIQDALGDFNQCMKNNAPPFSLKNLACFVGCTPALLGTPALYAACVVVCNAGVSGSSAIEAGACMAALEADEAAALQSYCSCLDYQDEHCNDGSEPSTIDCSGQGSGTP